MKVITTYPLGYKEPETIMESLDQRSKFCELMKDVLPFVSQETFWKISETLTEEKYLFLLALYYQFKREELEKELRQLIYRS